MATNGRQWVLILAATWLAAPAARAITVQETPLEITGFLDVLYATAEATAGERDFRLGQAELDFFACTSDHSCACLAVAYDPATATFGLGAATIEFIIAGTGSDCRHHYEKWERSGLVVGQFDVPFGIDWLVYPSVDRRLASAPDAVTATHDGWNELGVSFFIEAPRYTLRAWLVNGFDVELDGAGEPLLLATESAIGGRASVLPAAGLELGVSAAGFSTPDETQSMSLLGFDAQATQGPWALKVEMVRHRLDFGTPGDFTNRGWYAQGTRDFRGWHLFTRYDAVDFAGDEDGGGRRADVEALTFGAGLAVAAPAELRLEYRAALDEAHDDQWQAQLVAGF